MIFRATWFAGFLLVSGLGGAEVGPHAMRAGNVRPEKAVVVQAVSPLVAQVSAGAERAPSPTSPGGAAEAKPTVANFAISPKEVRRDTTVTLSFDYANVPGGLGKAKIVLLQKIQIPGDERVVERTSNWQAHLGDLDAFVASSGRLERSFVNKDAWRGPGIDLVYRLKIVDANGRESNVAETIVTPR